jgi:hypothetical protein
MILKAQGTKTKIPKWEQCQTKTYLNCKENDQHNDIYMKESNYESYIWD